MLPRSLLLLILACFCASPRAADKGPTQFLDERTGATITVVREPLVFALDRSILAANARDYVNFTAAEIDRSGHIQLYLIGYIWSTIDRRHNESRADLAKRPVEIAADGRVIRLTPDAEFPKDFLDDRQLLAPKWSDLQRAAYVITREQLRHIAYSKKLSLSFVADPAEGDAQSDAERDEEREVYDSWNEGRKALQAFVEQTGAYQ
jgi:hypothetical protein